MRLLPRSPRNNRPFESIASVCGPSISPGAVPFLPQVLMNVPSLANFTMRALVLPPCPSATKISPLDATSTADGALNSLGPSPALPGVPSVISNFPSGLNLWTVCPLAPRPTPSVTQTLPSKSTVRPCGNTNSPAPNFLTSLPEASNFRIGSRLEPSQLKTSPSRICDGGMKPCAPQRSATQMLLPSRSMPTPAVEPQMRPSGISPQRSMVRYGLGAELVGLVWARAWVAVLRAKAAAAMAAIRVNFISASHNFLKADCRGLT